MVNIFVQANTILLSNTNEFWWECGTTYCNKSHALDTEEMYPPWRCISLSSSLKQSWMNPKAKRFKRRITGKVRVSERCVSSTSFSQKAQKPKSFLTNSLLVVLWEFQKDISALVWGNEAFPPSSSRSLCTALAVFLAVATDHHEPWCQF